MNILEIHNTWNDAEPGGIVFMLTDLLEGLTPTHHAKLLVSNWQKARWRRAD